MEFQFGDWLVSPEANLVSNGDAKTQLEPRVMAVLRYLCRHPGAVIPAEEILQACWGSNELGDNPVHKAITQLRRAFGDSSTEPRYIETIRKRGYRAIAPVVTFAAPPATTWEGGSPFRGLEAFQENHAAIFFGRVQATAQLRELVLAQAAHGCPMALVLGPSGSGKTSLVRAGLLPQLMAGAIRSDEPIGLSSTVYLDCADLGSGTLFQALAGALIDAEIDGEPLFPGASADSLGQRLATDPGAVAAELRERACPRAQVAVFVDRVEAVFRAQPVDAGRFLEVIEVLAKSNCLLMLMACRNDFYPEVMAQPVLMSLKMRGGHFDVLPPDGADIAQIVRQPAFAAGLTFEEEETTGASLDDVLCDAARGNHDMLPLLQYTLNELYRQRSEDGRLRFDIYRQLGGIEGAVGVRAEQVVSQLSSAQIGALPHVLSLVVIVGEEQSTITSRRAPLSLLRNECEEELVRVMVEARLFVSELAGDVPSFGVAHEALLRQWPRVIEWIERHRVALQLRTRISNQAKRWFESERSRDLLLPRGIQVSQAAELLEQKDFSLAPIERDFVRASILRARIADRIKLAVTTLIGFLAVLTAFLAIGARSAQREAEQNRSEAEGLMTFMLGDFVEKLRPIGRMDILDDVGNKALTYLGKTESNSVSSGSLVSRLKALRIIAEVNITRSRPDTAAQVLDSARLLISKAPPSLAQNPEFLHEAGVHSFTSGNMHLARNELDLAEHYFNNYRQFSDRFGKVTPDEVQGLLERSYAHNSLGNIALTRGNYANASREFEQALELKKRALAQKPYDSKITADLANSIAWLAEATLKSGNPLSAMKLYRDEDALLRRVYTQDAKWSDRLALSLMRQGLLHVAFGEKREAVRVLLNAEQIMHDLLSKDPANRIWQSRLLQAQGRLAEVQLTRDNAAQTLARLQEVIEKLAELSAMDPKNTFLAYQTVKFELGRTAILQSIGRSKEALQNSEHTLSKLEQLYAKAKNDRVLLAFFAESMISRAELALQQNDNETEKRLCERTSELLNQSPGAATELSLLALQVRTNLCLGRVIPALSQIGKLKEMGYREARYQQMISTHHLLKGKL
ncbi:MAG TPA: winged helix-turn-helix domain-containing protein [Pseudoduganella sp.]